MIAIDETLISDYLRTIKFSCDLKHCLGACCVEGDAGAPLEAQEVDIITNNIDSLKPYLTEEGADWVDLYGTYEFDPAGNLVTPLLEGKECAFAFFDGEIARCAMEKAYEEGAFPLRKPVSCHLYPVRVKKYKYSEAVNYHEWHVCQPALIKGRNEGIPLYIFLKEPLIRKYGQKWYDQLVAEIAKKQ
jgi:hypothetical protein